MSRRWFPLTLQRTKFLQMGGRKIFLPYNTRTCFCLLSGKSCAIFSKKPSTIQRTFSCHFLSIREEKISPLSKKRGHHDLRILGFERTASTAAVRTRGNFGSIPSPYSVDVERKLRNKSAAKVYEQSMRESLARRPFLKLESFATQCEALLPYDRERCIIRTIFVAGSRTEMAISYNKLWKQLVDKKMSKADLRKAAGIAPNTMTRLRRDEEVTLSVLNRICVTLDVNIGDVMEFVPEGK